LLLRCAALLLTIVPALPAGSAVLFVPGQYATVSAAISAAASGDVIEIAPGLYTGALTVSGKALEIRSRFATTGDPADVEATVLATTGADVVTTLAGASLVLRGLTLQGGAAAARVNAGTHLEFLDGQVRDTSDGISLEGGSTAADGIARATIRRSLLEGSSDDAVDSDNKSELWIEDSLIRDNGDDGIEIRLHNGGFAAGESITHVIRRSVIRGNGEDGLQLIDYSDLTPRSIRIERTLFADNVMAGLGLMCNGNTIESFEGCPIPETIRLVNNTFVGNDHGLSGGANLVGVNNLFVGNTTLGAKNVAGTSLLAENGFFGNGTNHAGSNVDAASTLLADPLLTSAYLLQDGSPAIDAGVAFFTYGAEVVVDLPTTAYGGAAPDLGAFEWVPGTGADPQQVEVRIAAGSDDAEQGATSVALTGSDLELVTDGAVVQTVGLRFPSLALPPNALILAAWIQLRADETGTSAASLLVQGQASDNPPTFASTADNVSNRPRTAAAVSWAPPPWTVVGAADAAQRTPDLSEVVQELVDRPGWASGNAMAFIVTGSGTRTADSFEGLATGAPLLHVEYVEPGCGNAFVEPGEACDDGNLAPGDGCDGACQITTACSDGVDNDVDAHVDAPLDPGCADASDDAERDPGLPCDDGLDNDGDGGSDFAGDDDGDGVSDPPGDLGCAGPTSPREDPECQDGLDNDAAPGIDYDGGASVEGGVPLGPADPQCALPSTSREAADVPADTSSWGCGLGPELLAVFVSLAEWRRRWLRRAARPA
jgi:cysteine-rich repeat protein